MTGANNKAGERIREVGRQKKGGSEIERPLRRKTEQSSVKALCLWGLFMTKSFSV